ncbi:MAG TPA: DUF58 domain-containing protein [Thermoplasmata archaeon]|nr:DUF58 domain-containing protein [Thermoplasmata archaeon]
MLTRRGWAAVATSLFTLVLGVFSLNLLVLVIGVAALTVVATETVGFAVGTWRFTAAPFTLHRAETSERVGTGATVVVGLELEHRRRRAFWAEVFDTVPESFDLVGGSPRLRLWWDPGATIRLAYAYRPTLRGVFRLGPVIVVAHDPMGFAFRVAVVGVPLSVAIAPAFPTTRLGLVGERLATRAFGATALRRRGFGTEFRALRPYEPGDDIRSIAWKRSTPDELIVRENEQESREDFVVLLDAGPSMAAGPAGATALDHAADAAGLLAGHVARREDRLGLLVYADGPIAWIPPGRGSRHALTVAQELARTAPRASRFDLSGALAFLRLRLGRRAHILTFSALETRLNRLPADHAQLTSRGHRLHLFVPRIAALYPATSAPLADAAVGYATGIEARRLDRALGQVHERGIPTFLYDRRGAAARLLSVYARIRTWGAAW